VSQILTFRVFRRFEMSEVATSEVVVEKTEDPMMEEIRSQLRISSAVREYLRAVEQFETASKEFHDSCKAVRESIKPDSRFVLRSGYKHYLVTSDGGNNFNVESIEII
jgi:hypothetical protein